MKNQRVKNQMKLKIQLNVIKDIRNEFKLS
jgi:hypothetical protein